MKDGASDKNNPITGLTPELMAAFADGTLSEEMMEQVKLYLEENPFEAETSLYCYDPDDPEDPDFNMRNLLPFPVGRLSLIADAERKAWEESYLKWLKGKLKDMLD